MPLFPVFVHAESVGGSSPIIGVNINILDYEYGKIPYQASVNFSTDQTRWQCTSSHSTMGCQVWQSQTSSGSVTDDITGTITYSSTSVYSAYLYEYEFVLDKNYVGSITFSSNSLGATTNNIYYVNGSSFTLTSTSLITSFTVSSYNLRAYRDDVYTFPIESYPMVYYCLSQGFEATDMQGYGYYQYPMFVTNTSSYISAFQANPNSDIFVILWSDRAINTSNATSYLTWSSDYSLVSAEMLAYAPGNRTVKLTFHNNSSSAVRLDLKWAVNDRTWFPIYQWYVQEQYQVSTEFGLLYDLPNSYIITIEGLQPTQQTEDSSDDLETSADDIVQNSSTMFQFENQQNTNMNNALQSINTNFDIGSIGSSFLTSAAWVKTQFDNLANTTPFGSVLSFSLLLGLALLIIGKVYK